MYMYNNFSLCCSKIPELLIYRLPFASVRFKKSTKNDWTCSVSAQLSICVIWRRRIVRNLERWHEGWHRTQHDPSLMVKLLWPTGYVYTTVRRSGFKWISVKCGLIVIRTHLKQGHSAQNVTRYTMWNGVLSVIQSAMVPILICATITGDAELS